MVTSAVIVVRTPAFGWRATAVLFSVLVVIASSLAALPLLLTVSALVSRSRAVLLALAVPLPPLFLFLVCFCGSV